jgi:hypothetical protein
MQSALAVQVVRRRVQPVVDAPLLDESEIRLTVNSLIGRFEIVLRSVSVKPVKTDTRTTTLLAMGAS